MAETGTPLLMKAELLPGEKLLQSFGANALLPMYRDAGDTGAKPYVLGASAPRKVLGMLHLTNYRLKFKPADPHEAAFSIFLPAIARISNVSFLFVRKFRLMMHDGTHIDFLRWGIVPAIAAINAASMAADQLDWDAIGQDIAAAPDKIGAWAVTAPGDQPTVTVASNG